MGAKGEGGWSPRLSLAGAAASFLLQEWGFWAAHRGLGP